MAGFGAPITGRFWAPHDSNLAWQAHREQKAIQFLRSNGANVDTVTTYNIHGPRWATVLLHGHARWLWVRALEVGNYGQWNNVPQSMAAVGNLKSLQGLFLTGVPVADSDLVNLKNLTTLRVLCLDDDTSVTDAGLVNLQGLKTLNVLYLRGAPVTDAGLANLKALTALQHLDLSYTYVTDAGLVNLKGLTALRQLNLSHTEVTNAGVAKLQSSLPKCKVDH
jgi:hypothetical protein